MPGVRMPNTRKALVLLIIATLLSTAAVLLAADKKSKSKKSANEPVQMDDTKKALHALNRFTFGPRPGDLETVRSMGLDKWFDQQLHPDKIDDSAIETRLAPFRTLKMSPREMVENFPPPQVLKAVENGRISMPSDPGKRAIYQARMAAYEARQQNKADAGAGAKANDDQDMKAMAQDDEKLTSEQRQARLKQREDQMYADLGGPSLIDLSPDERYKKILKMTPEERQSMARSLRGEEGMKLMDGMKPEQRETLQAIVNPQAVVGGEAAQAKLLRSIYSNRQLEEVMTDFWFNHFNVFIGKGPDRYMITAYERDVVRPHALGKFKDLLVSTAKSPAMLFYLDNWQSVGPNSDLAKYGPQRRRPAGGFQRGGFGGGFGRPRPPNQNQGNQQGNIQQQKNRPSGLNENYAREIMELHTLGVDGGYTQKDVTELAKVLTGWSIQQPQRGGDFSYNAPAHEPGTKPVLGHDIKEHAPEEPMERF